MSSCASRDLDPTHAALVARCEVLRGVSIARVDEIGVDLVLNEELTELR